MKTKIITFCFIIISISAVAQNWKTINQQDTTYFAVDKPSGVDSEWHGFLRCVWIDSAKLIGGDSVFYFNPALDRDSSGIACTDTISGTFLGKKVKRTTNGIEYYYNELNEPIEIRTLASLNDSWKMISDTSGLDFFGTISNVYTTLIDGVTDSIKEISIQAFNNGTPVNNYYNNFKLALSKDHGFIETNHLDIFPYWIFGAWQPGSFLFQPKIPLSHKRVPADIKTLDFNKIDFAKKFQPGNEWIIRTASGYGKFDPPDYNTSFSGDIYTKHDSILSVNILNANTVAYTFQRKQHHLYINQVTQNNTDTTLIITDTVYQNNPIFILNSKLSSDIKDTAMDMFQLSTILLNLEYYFLDKICNFPVLRTYRHGAYYTAKTLQDSCYTTHASISGYNTYDTAIVSTMKFNLRQIQGFDYWQALLHDDKEQLLFLKADSCTYGNKINVLTLTLENVKKANDSFTIFPNPAEKFLNFSFASATIVENITILDLSGNVIIASNFDNRKIDVSNLASGLYIVKINTNKGVYRKKILKN
ncbi:MAG: T9SS type A sorting domain-containing protein [Bacteroidetes bacterium]|nr:T9SS type A sorting domain-containing protein [Bacteroidota bacterium]